MLPVQKIAYTAIASRSLRVSTVKLTVNRGTISDPLWYESLVLPLRGWAELYYRRYATESDALEGHAEIVALIETAGLPSEVSL